MKGTRNNKKKMVTIAIICSVYLLLTICYHHIDKHLTGLLFIILTLLIPITFIAIVVFEIKSIIYLFSNRQSFNLISSFPVAICSLTLLYTLFCPYQYRLDTEKLESKVEFRACYEGTQNQAYILFRKDKTFELNWTGVFGYNEWFVGKWDKKGDTLYLNYDSKRVEQLGNKILISKGYLNPIGSSVDKKKFPYPMFYLGFCRHEN